MKQIDVSTFKTDLSSKRYSTMNILPDSFQEIASTMKQNKLRTFLTGFAVTWGVMLLVILLSSGMGFQKAMYRNLRNTNSTQKVISISPGITQEPYKGFKKGRYVKIPYADAINICNRHSDMVKQYGISIDYYSFNLTYKNKSTGPNGYIQGVNEAFIGTTTTTILYGREINKEDVTNSKKVIVISEKTAIDLYNNAASAVGKTLNWRNMNFIVVGVFKTTNTGNYQNAFIPISTLINTSSGYIYISEIRMVCPTLKDTKDGNRFANIIKREVRARYSVAPNDTGIYVSNEMSDSETIRKIFTGIDIFMWILGFSTLIIGLMGVANIMLVSVNERSAEIGIRKALGAKPRAIIRMILRESILITVTFGMIGVALGTIGMFIIDRIISSYAWASKTINGMTITLFYDPMITFRTAVAIVIVMIICGAISGYLPARKTLKISAVDAMRK